ncbi:trypsin-like serine protease, partial [Streptomyces sp. NPDC001941]|uniref:trypsin-like serine protease n=1 Tax=Streptomyces sp. NPDC001941 TaxID=3154659 RepID=UPI00332437A1
MSSTRPRSATLAAALATATAVTGLMAAPTQAAVGDGVPAGTYSFTAKLTIGADDTLRSCSGALVDSEWVLTAASCFAPDPKKPTAVSAGKPAMKTVATIGRSDLSGTSGQVRDVIEVVPYADRDVAMVRLAQSVTTVAPVALATSATATGDALTSVGYGRTKTEWIPNQLHVASFTASDVSATDVTATGKSATDSVCMGDTGGPTLRESGGKTQLVAVNSRSWQGGCYGVEETRTGAVNARVDDLAGWVKTVRTRDRIHSADIDGDGKADLVQHRTNGDLVVYRNLGTKLGPGTVMSSGWGRFVDGADLGRLYFADVTGDGKADLIVHGRDGKVSVRKNMGTYFDGGTDWSSGWGRFVDGADLGRLYFADITGDGKADLIVHGRDGKVSVRKNMGTYFDGGT